ncbi:TPA: transposase domain-containing protein [Escherichia coli]|nr:transposase domain-containing protein [Escherichia coli]
MRKAFTQNLKQARLIGTCRLNGIDPEAYLRHILSVLPEWPSNRVDELLPWNVVLTNK